MSIPTTPPAPGTGDGPRKAGLEAALAVQISLYKGTLAATALLSLAYIAAVTRAEHPSATAIVCEPSDQPVCGGLDARHLMGADAAAFEPSDTWRDATTGALWNLNEHSQDAWGGFDRDTTIRGVRILFIVDEIASADDELAVTAAGPYCRFCHRLAAADGQRIGGGVPEGENRWVCGACWDDRLA